jgi:hypothetical protein
LKTTALVNGKRVKHVAGIKLLGHAIISNAEKIARRYPDDDTKHMCLAVSALGRQLVELADDGIPLSITIARQAELPFSWEEDALNED